MPVLSQDQLDELASQRDNKNIEFFSENAPSLQQVDRSPIATLGPIPVGFQFGTAAGIRNPFVALTVDILTDPLTYAGGLGALTKIGRLAKVAKGVGSAERVAKIAAVTARNAKRFETIGKLEKELKTVAGIAIKSPEQVKRFKRVSKTLDSLREFQAARVKSIASLEKKAEAARTLEAVGAPLSLAEDAASQAAQELPQRALLTVAGKPIIRGSKVFQKLPEIRTRLLSTPIGRVLSETFSSNVSKFVRKYPEARELVEGVRADVIAGDVAAAKKRLALVDSIPEEGQRQLMTIILEDAALSFQAGGEALVKSRVIRDNYKNLKLDQVADNALQMFIEADLKAVDPDILLKISDDFRLITNKLIEEGLLTEEVAKDFYLNHSFIQETGFVQAVKTLMSPLLSGAGQPFLKERTIEGTIAQINKKAGKKIVEDDIAKILERTTQMFNREISAKKFADGILKLERVVKDIPEGGRLEEGFVEAALTGLPKAHPVRVAFEGKQIPKELAEEFGKAINILARKPEEVIPVLRAYDGALRAWKAWTLGIFPAYHSRNALSNFFLNYLAGVDVRRYGDAARFQLGHQKFFELDGVVYHTKDLEQLMVKKRVLNTGFVGSEIAKQGGPAAFRNVVADNKITRLGQRAGTFVENHFRVALFMDRLKKGDSIDDAALAVKRYLFDFNDLSKSEKVFFRRLFPFYSWTRNNVPAMMRELILQPRKFGNVSKALSVPSKGDPVVLGDPLSPFIKDSVPVQVSRKGDLVQHLLLKNLLPSADLVTFTSGPRVVREALAMMTPALKIPAELITGKSTFFRGSLGNASDIERFPGQRRDFLGAKLSVKTINVLKNLRILSTLDRIVRGKGSIQGDIAGLKTFDTDVKRSAKFMKRAIQFEIADIKRGMKRETDPEEKQRLKDAIQERLDRIQRLRVFL